MPWLYTWILRTMWFMWGHDILYKGHTSIWMHLKEINWLQHALCYFRLSSDTVNRLCSAARAACLYVLDQIQSTLSNTARDRHWKGTCWNANILRYCVATLNLYKYVKDYLYLSVFAVSQIWTISSYSNLKNMFWRNSNWEIGAQEVAGIQCHVQKWFKPLNIQFQRGLNSS